jgi:basic amino acid/polyamine antiporter, APA family
MSASGPSAAATGHVYDEKPGLLRALSPAAASAIVLGTMIGTGIFLKPSEMAAEGRSISVVFAALIAGGILSLFGALCYVELGTMIPEAGGEYAYLRRGFGTVWGFLFGWMHSTVARPASVAAIAAGFLRFCAFFFPQLASPLYRVHLHLPFFSNVGSEFAFTWSQPLAVAALVLITFVNYLGVRVGGRVQVALTACKVAAVLAIIIGGFWLMRGHTQPLRPMWPQSLGWGTWRGFLAAMAAALWAYDGWNDLNLVGSEVEAPERNFPRVVIGSVFFVIVVFLLFHLVCFYALPLSVVASSQHVASDVFQSFAGKAGALWITVAMCVSALGTLNASALSGARVDYAMARDGVFFDFAAFIHPRFHTPSNALVFQCIIASVMALTGTFEELTSLVMFGSWIFYGLAVLAMLRMRRTEPTLARPYRTWGYPVVPVIFVFGAATLAVSLWMARPVRCSIGLALILFGLVFYRSWRMRASSEAQ